MAPVNAGCLGRLRWPSVKSSHAYGPAHPAYCFSESQLKEKQTCPLEEESLRTAACAAITRGVRLSRQLTSTR